MPIVRQITNGTTPAAKDVEDSLVVGERLRLGHDEEIGQRHHLWRFLNVLRTNIEQILAVTKVSTVVH
jgi:hypothetical protein